VLDLAAVFPTCHSGIHEFSYTLLNGAPVELCLTDDAS